ncbi:cupin domain-containing protein [Baekduia soli]|uniref:Cupin domain-containing protein n=1 Tax=Baekduia soli TaxID=496014 RepID=A0A5B8U7B2_9ACTN|nr:cupin domain-containing protein [Baekduia soli]QEC49019.1 cupin domain-containing protein [Baekduia soli]
MHEAKIIETDTGLQPSGDGWFILNLKDIGWATVPGGGTWCVFEAPDAPSATLGIGVHILDPGDTPGFYHLESDQEGFLVLSGECLAIVEGQERRMGPWDYLHSPPGTAHITVGAGEGPCALLMVGTRTPGGTTHYPADPVAAAHGAAVAEATDSPREAYADRPTITPARSPWPVA